MRKQTDLHLGWPESEYILSYFLCVNMKCIHVIGVGFVPLSGDGVGSALHLFPSVWAAAVASGVGLVLQLFSIFTGEESAIELWLLFSSIRENHSLSFKSQYSNDIQILAWLRDWPCMSIIPGEELFSGVVTSDPYFSSLPFFFLFFCSEVKQNINELQLRQKKSMHSCRTALTTYTVWLWLSHWNPFEDTQWSVSNRHPFFLPVNF